MQRILLLLFVVCTPVLGMGARAPLPGKVPGLSERPKVEAGVAVVKFNAIRPPEPDEELARLEAALEEALTQSEMTVRSGAIGRHLEARLSALEERIAQDLEADSRALFQKAARIWREYRSAQVDFEGDLYRGGSIQSLIHNRTFSRLTQERLDALRMLGAEGEYRNY